MPRAINEAVDNSNPAVSVGVQSWSRGPVFPAVIAVRETYDTPVDFDTYCSGGFGAAVGTFLAARAYQHHLEAFYHRPLAERLVLREYVLQYPGLEEQAFQLYDTAVRVAQGYNAAGAA